MKIEEIEVGKTYFGGINHLHARKVLRIRNSFVVSSDRREGFHPLTNTRLKEFARWAIREVQDEKGEV